MGGRRGEGGGGEGGGGGLGQGIVPFPEAHRREFGTGHREGESVTFYSVS